MSVSLLTPAAALVCFTAALPLAAAARGAAVSTRVRSALGLSAPAGRAVVGYVALATTVVCLGLAAGQPVLSRSAAVQVRSDAQVLFVMDVSQSMAASAAPGSATRLARAREAARRLRETIPEVEAGIATLTDRVLPDLLPVPDGASFGATLARSVQLQQPPPLEVAVRATTFAALADVVRGNYFTPAASMRVVVLLTDGETRPFDEGGVARALSREGITVEAIHVGSARESIYDATGRADPAYVPDQDSRHALASLAGATGGRVFDERDLDGAASALRDELGRGPTRATGSRREDEVLLAPLVAALALVPFAFLAFRRDGVGTPLVHAARRLVS
jgi:hypothetical protein